MWHCAWENLKSIYVLLWVWPRVYPWYDLYYRVVLYEVLHKLFHIILLIIICIENGNMRKQCMVCLHNRDINNCHWTIMHLHDCPMTIVSISLHHATARGIKLLYIIIIQVVAKFHMLHIRAIVAAYISYDIVCMHAWRILALKSRALQIMLLFLCKMLCSNSCQHNFSNANACLFCSKFRCQHNLQSPM